MLYKKLALILLTGIQCYAMENTVELSGLVIQTQDNMLVEIPHKFVEACTYLKNMLEDVAPADRSQEPISIKEVHGQALTIAIKLVSLFPKEKDTDQVSVNYPISFKDYQQKTDILFFLGDEEIRKSESIVTDHLKTLDLISLAHLLTTVNFLDCKILFKMVLQSLCKSIEQSTHKKIDHTFYQALEDILPLDLQKIVYEHLLIENELILRFMTTSKSDEKLRLFLPDEVSCTFTSSKRFLKVRDERRGIYIFDCKEHPAEQIGAFESLDSFFSPDETLMLIITNAKNSQFILLNLMNRTKKCFPVPAILKTFGFSDDSKLLVINESVYDIETGAAVARSMIPLPINSPSIAETGNTTQDYSDLKVRYPELKKLKNSDSVCKQLESEIALAKDIHVSDDAHYICIVQPRRGNARYLWKLHLFKVCEDEAINKLIHLENIKSYAFTNSFVLIAALPLVSLRNYDITNYHIGCIHFIPQTWTRYYENNSYNLHDRDSFFGSEDSQFIERFSPQLTTFFEFAWCYYIKTTNMLKKFKINITTLFRSHFSQRGVKFLDENRIMILDEEHPHIVTIPFNFLMKNYSLKEFLIQLKDKKNPLAMLAKEFSD